MVCTEDVRPCVTYIYCAQQTRVTPERGLHRGCVVVRSCVMVCVRCIYTPIHICAVPEETLESGLPRGCAAVCHLYLLCPANQSNSSEWSALRMSGCTVMRHCVCQMHIYTYVLCRYTHLRVVCTMVYSRVSCARAVQIRATLQTSLR